MACNGDIDITVGKYIKTIESAQTEAGGDLTAGLMVQNDVFAKAIPLTICNDTSNGNTNTKLVGMDFYLFNNGSVILTETIKLILYDVEPLASGVAIVAGAAFSTVDDAYNGNIVYQKTLSSIALQTGKTDILVATFGEDEISGYCRTSSNTSTLYALLVTLAGTPNTIVAGATLDTRFKFEGVKG